MMKKAVGRGAATRKYDLLSVLGSYALSQDKHVQKQALRLICLITARYNWQSDELSIGQNEISKLWSVDVRTVKREMAALRKRGWLVEKRPAARGRVALYGLNVVQILEDTREGWAKIGPDLVERLAPVEQSAPQTNVVPLRVADMPSDGIWSEVARRLQRHHPTAWGAWFAQLSVLSEDRETLVLRAGSEFQASYIDTHLRATLEAVIRSVAPQIQRVQIIAHV
ncbi:hypothetical protein [Thioclava sp. FTW29]|uniref:DnaA N-terminal domain-containing protein n=1 Tax=Thioclava litoralis TaxID=3076557 RepID=A0ABZ1E5V6_9RHOB|nr:hypothetical protein RPE78_14625 [Thioclava sp. FTW29]